MTIAHFPPQGSEPGRTPVRVSWEESPFAQQTLGKPYRDYNWSNVPCKDDLIIIDHIRLKDSPPESYLFRVQSVPIWCEGGVLLHVQFLDTVERK